MTSTPGDMNEEWHRFPQPRSPAEFGLSDFEYSGGVKVFGAALTLGDRTVVPAAVFRFARADGTGFFKPIALVAQPDELRVLSALVDQATAAALVAAQEMRRG